jgi:hypothetical protein
MEFRAEPSIEEMRAAVLQESQESLRPGRVGFRH